MNRRLSFFLAATLAGSLHAGELPEKHRADFHTWMESKDTAEVLPAADRLRSVLAAEGEAGEVLAQYILTFVEGAERLNRNPYHLLIARAVEFGEGGTFEPHIDGPYLKRLAAMSIPDDANQRRFRDHHAAVAYLQLHPEDHELYWRLRLAATRDAKVARFPTGERELLFGKRGEVPERDAVREFVRKHYPQPVGAYGLTDAWDILMRLGVLKPGMRVDEAVKVLGEPTHKGENFLRWYHDTPRHVNPNLSAEVKDGKIVRFRSGKA